MSGKRSSDAIVFIGLNHSASREVQELRRLHNQVAFIGPSKEPDKVQVGQRIYDLRVPDQQAAFLSALKVSATQSDIISDALGGESWNRHSEIAQLAVIWARVEKGERPPGRMVISGHHSGAGLFWGDGKIMLSSANVRTLAKAFPRSASAVEDLHLAACYSAVDLTEWLTVFPGLQTIWAYSGSAPGTDKGAALHLRFWDRATRGSAYSIDRSKVEGTRKGHNVAIWSQRYGLQTATIESLDTLRQHLLSAEPQFGSFFEGDISVVDTETGPLRDIYNFIQAILQHTDLPEAERPMMERRREVTVRLLHYDSSIKRNFAVNYRSQIEAGYSALKMPIPDFSQLSRKQALSAVSAFTKNLNAASPQAAAQLGLLLTKGLRDLDQQYIPITWI